MTFARDARQHAPATERNRQPILEVLDRVLPSTGSVLEVASGTGQHAVFFAPRLKPRRWLPSDPQPLLRDSIQAWQNHAPADNLHPPLALDVKANSWPVEGGASPPELAEFPITAVVAINLIHIAPWSACEGLIAGCDRILPPGGILYLYGPYKIDGRHTAPSNESFDQYLQSSDPSWGVRDLDDVVKLANSHHLKLLETVAMPANNFSVVFERS